MYPKPGVSPWARVLTAFQAAALRACWSTPCPGADTVAEYELLSRTVRSDKGEDTVHVLELALPARDFAETNRTSAKLLCHRGNEGSHAGRGFGGGRLERRGRRGADFGDPGGDPAAAPLARRGSAGARCAFAFGLFRAARAGAAVDARRAAGHHFAADRAGGRGLSALGPHGGALERPGSFLRGGRQPDAADPGRRGAAAAGAEAGRGRSGRFRSTSWRFMASISPSRAPPPSWFCSTRL